MPFTSTGRKLCLVMKSKEAKTIPCRHCAGTGRLLDVKAIGIAMQARREKAGLTLREVAADMGISVGYLSDREHGRKQYADADLFDARNLKAILKLLEGLE